MSEIKSDDDIRRVLKEARTLAVLGAHPDASRPAYYVPDYLHRKGYRILPVNAMYAGQVLWGETVRASLADLGQPVDIVDVFRRSEALDAHLPEILAMQPRPKVVWLQEGIRNDAVAARLIGAGIAVVQDRCAKQAHLDLV